MAISLFKNNLIISSSTYIKINNKILNVKKQLMKIHFFSKPVDGDVGETIALS